jgi:hypothetical protein
MWWATVAGNGNGNGNGVVPKDRVMGKDVSSGLHDAVRCDDLTICPSSDNGVGLGQLPHVSLLVTSNIKSIAPACVCGWRSELGMKPKSEKLSE